MPKEETFPIPLKQIDATRTTHTNLDVLEESRFDDHCNVDVHRKLSDSWKGFTKFTLLNEKPPKRFLWSGERLTKIQATTRTDYLWREILSSMSKAVQKNDKKEWAIEEPKIDDARNMRGKCFIDLEDGQYKQTIKHARKIGSSNGAGNALQDGNKEALKEAA